MKTNNMTTPSPRNSISRPPLRRGLPRKQQLPRIQAMWIIRGFLLIPLVLALGAFALSPTARAVDPPPDGGYPNQNTAEGEDALFSFSTDEGNNNTALGFHALYSAYGGELNTATGANALFSNLGAFENTANGAFALYSNTTGHSNTANGVVALYSNNGNFNTATGDFALYSNTTGSSNTATGLDALYYNTTGNNNTAIGVNALFGNTTGSSNTASGASALQNNNADNNTANGSNGLFSNTSGTLNTAGGASALFSNTTGSNNTASGSSALAGNTTGNSNIALGVLAGENLTTGDNNIDIGNSGVAAESNTIRIGKHATHTATFIAGISGATVTGRAVVVNRSGQLGIAPSSERFKDAIKPMDKASKAIFALKPVTFRYKPELDPDGTAQFGLVAEQVEKVNSDLVARDNQGKPYTVRYEAVNAMLLNEFLKEHHTVQELKSTAVKQEATIAKQQKQIEALTRGLQKVSDQLEVSKPAPRTVVNNQ
jgi:hypothetical protein